MEIRLPVSVSHTVSFKSIRFQWKALLLTVVKNSQSYSADRMRTIVYILFLDHRIFLPYKSCPLRLYCYYDQRNCCSLQRAVIDPNA